MSGADPGAGPFCADINLGEPLPGTAPHATGWVIVEADGPWGAKALQDGPLGPELGPELDRRAEATTARVQLARPPGRGRGADSDGASGRSPGTRVWLAAAGRVLVGELSDPRELLELDLAAIAAGDLPDLGSPAVEPLLFVCQNGKRDACCARLGRPLVVALDAEFPGQVWETNHLNGHRFAATALVLPDATLHGRLDADAARALLADAADGLTSWSHCRGRTSLERPAQAAELAVRERLGTSAAADLTVQELSAEGDVSGPPELRDASRLPELRYRVAHRDGRSWTVAVDAVELAPRPESCNKPPVPATSFVPRVIS